MYIHFIDIKEIITRQSSYRIARKSMFPDNYGVFCFPCKSRLNQGIPSFFSVPSDVEGWWRHRNQFVKNSEGTRDHDVFPGDAHLQWRLAGSGVVVWKFMNLVIKVDLECINSAGKLAISLIYLCISLNVEYKLVLLSTSF